MMWHWFGHGGFGWVGMIIMAVFWAVVIGLIIWGVVRMGRRGCCMPYEHDERALDIARERYAKGEISKEQFEQIKKDLS